MKLILKALFFFSFLLILGACSGSKKSGDGESKKQKKPKKCKYDHCHVRLNHYHNKTEYKGKRGGAFTGIFSPKSPHYGQGLPRYRKEK